jgi:hypothetical protein
VAQIISANSFGIANFCGGLKKLAVSSRRPGLVAGMRRDSLTIETGMGGASGLDRIADRVAEAQRY